MECYLHACQSEAEYNFFVTLMTGQEEIDYDFPYCAKHIDLMHDTFKDSVYKNQRVEPIADGYNDVAVADLHVNCSLRVRNFDALGFAASDNCNKPAYSVVKTDSGALMYRCVAHEGIISMRTGEISRIVKVKMEFKDQVQ